VNYECKVQFKPGRLFRHVASGTVALILAVVDRDRYTRTTTMVVLMRHQDGLRFASDAVFLDEEWRRSW
jgi:hypothetical protein